MSFRSEKSKSIFPIPQTEKSIFSIRQTEKSIFSKSIFRLNIEFQQIHHVLHYLRLFLSVHANKVKQFFSFLIFQNQLLCFNLSLINTRRIKLKSIFWTKHWLNLWLWLRFQIEIISSISRFWVLIEINYVNQTELEDFDE